MRHCGKTLILLIATQLAGLAIGLWIHHRFVALSVSREIYEQGWADLARASEQSLAHLPTAPQQMASEAGALQQALRAARPDPHTRLLLLDHSWRVLAADEPSLKPGQALGWKLAVTSRTAVGQTLPMGPTPLRGFIQLGADRHLGLAWPRPQANGYVVLHRAVDSVTASPAALQKPLLPAALITFVWTAGVLGVMAYLILTRLYDRYARKSAESETAALRHTESMARMRDAVIFGLAKLTESRDPETGQHLERISLYCTRLAQTLRHHPKFRQLITPEFVRLIGISSILHDIGKVGIEDAILLKPGPLTAQERTRMQEHSIIGGVCIQDIERRLGSSNFLQMARQIAFSHHERWDGQGYPHGLTRNEIPLAARIVAVADVYEALSTKRVYKEAMPHDECVAYIREQAGKHFDPTIVEVFLKLETQFRDIGRRYADAYQSSASQRSSTESNGHKGAGGKPVPEGLLPPLAPNSSQLTFSN